MSTSPSTGATAPTAPTYRIIRVPRASPRLAELVTKSRTTRLHALETDATSFLAQHAVEAALPLETWHRRFSNPETTILACVATSEDTRESASGGSDTAVSPDDEYQNGDGDADVTLLLQRQWVAVAALRGPMRYEDYYATPDMGLPIPANPQAEARWHVYDLYTLPSHRGRGLAGKLVNACVAAALEGSRNQPADELGSELDISKPATMETTVRKARIRLFMNPATTWLVAMYEALGFQAAGAVTLEEGFRANCLDESIPGGTRESVEGRAKWHTRFGLAMERVVPL
ncbi:hypothetical protein N0V86_008630 [Didymella sp. IMI 355093]|nr:hypothetical protein N0V86_008630 [Didymella sp. IMI 355093]